ncbi:MAG: 16S rRNA (cytidine(1402)-2'-O)-methyltransferase [Thermodesulfobacteriota bacterium]
MKRDSAIPAGNQTPTGCLYVVATPIGNLEDITLRALRVLKEVGLIASEDTRHTRKLLSHFDIHTQLVSYYKEKEMERGQELVAELQAGKDIALVSDAGTPGISDPGGVLVRLAREQGIPVVPVPGVSALATLLSVRGATQPSHLFFGFLPSRGNERRKLLASVAELPHALVFYESPRRVVDSLADCLAVLGERSAVVGRELTKLHEEVVGGTLTSLLEEFRRREPLKGEFVVLVEPGEAREQPEATNLDELLIWYRDQSGLSLKDAAKRIAGDLGLSRSEVYQQALAVWKTGGDSACQK